MDRAALNAYCAGFAGAEHAVQWGNADVWKVAGKVFAICGWSEGGDAVTFKVTRLGFEVLTGLQGVRPAPYLASRAFTWVQVTRLDALPGNDLQRHIDESYAMIRAALPAARRKGLGPARGRPR